MLTTSVVLVFLSLYRVLALLTFLSHAHLAEIMVDLNHFDKQDNWGICPFSEQCPSSLEIK